MANDYSHENRWEEARNALDGLANYCITSGFDTDGIDLSFLNSSAKFSFAELKSITASYSPAPRHTILLIKPSGQG